MATFVTEIAKVIEPYLAKNGGPIIMAQIENEYIGNDDYVEWCGILAESLNMNVSWIMCNGQSADNTINTCNGNNCYSYAQSHSSKYPNQPLGWTENEGWFQSWNEKYNPNAVTVDNRSPADMAYAIALWFAAGGSHHNYYMWYGGNHLSWWAGSSIANYYANGVNYHSDGMPNEPKRSHLQKLHLILALYQRPILENSIQVGHEIPLVPVKLRHSTSQLLYVVDCDHASEWIFKSDSHLLQLKNSDQCLFSDGNINSRRMSTKLCDFNDEHQRWIIHGNQLKSEFDHSCIETDSKLIVREKKDCISKHNTFTLDINGYLINNKKCIQTKAALGTFAYDYNGSTDRITFLVNMESQNYTLLWNNTQYFVPSLSVTIINGNDTELYNTANVNSDGLRTERIYRTINNSLVFESWTENSIVSESEVRTDTATVNTSPLEQIRMSGNSEYLYYETQFNVSVVNRSLSLVFLGRLSNAYVIYLDGVFVGQVWDGTHSAGDMNYSLIIGSMNMSANHTLTILSSSLGIDNYNGVAVGQDSDAQDKKGLTGGVWLMDGMNISMDLTENSWLHWSGLTGENIEVFSSIGSNKVSWIIADNNPLFGVTWYKTTFVTTDEDMDSNGAILIDIGYGDGFTRGHLYVNGYDLGHYNNVIVGGYATQRYYFVPLDYLLSSGDVNVLMFVSEYPVVNVSNCRVVWSTVVPS